MVVSPLCERDRERERGESNDAGRDKALSQESNAGPDTEHGSSPPRFPSATGKAQGRERESRHQRQVRKHQLRVHQQTKRAQHEKRPRRLASLSPKEGWRGGDGA